MCECTTEQFSCRRVWRVVADKYNITTHSVVCVCMTTRLREVRGPLVLPRDVWHEVLRRFTPDEWLPLLATCRAFVQLLDPLLKQWLRTKLQVDDRRTQWLLVHWLQRGAIDGVGRTRWARDRFCLLSYAADQSAALSALSWATLLASISVAEQFVGLCCVMADTMYVCCHLTMDRVGSQSRAGNCFYSDHSVLFRPLHQCPEVRYVPPPTGPMDESECTVSALAQAWAQVRSQVNKKLAGELLSLVTDTMLIHALRPHAVERLTDGSHLLVSLLWRNEHLLQHWGTPQALRLAYHNGPQTTAEKRRGLVLMQRCQDAQESLLRTLLLRCDTFDAWVRYEEPCELVLWPSDI